MKSSSEARKHDDYVSLLLIHARARAHSYADENEPRLDACFFSISSARREKSARQNEVKLIDTGTGDMCGLLIP